MSSQNHTTNTNTEMTSTRKLAKLKPPSKSIVASSFHDLRADRMRPIHTSATSLNIALWFMGAISKDNIAGVLSRPTLADLSDCRRQQPTIFDALSKALQGGDGFPFISTGQ